MITNSTSTLNITNDKPIIFKVSGEISYLLGVFEQEIKEIYNIAGMESNSINRSLVIKNLLELGMRSENNILRIDRHNWSPLDILKKRFPNFEEINSIEDLNFGEAKENLKERLILTAEAMSYLTLDSKEGSAIKDKVEELIENRKITPLGKEVEIEEALFKYFYNGNFKEEEVVKSITLSLIKLPPFDVVSLYQAIDSYKYNILFCEVRQIIQKRVAKRLKNNVKILKINKKIPKKELKVE